jgi:hypothetical protein
MPDSRHWPPIRGYGWFLAPDPAAVTADQPFGSGEATAGPPPLAIDLPAGVLGCWTLDQTAEGLHNARTSFDEQGHCSRAVIERPGPPATTEGSIAEPAWRSDSLPLDPRGTRSVRLRRRCKTDATPWEPPAACEFADVPA